jgi:hypothetical protein
MGVMEEPWILVLQEELFSCLASINRRDIYLSLRLLPTPIRLNITVTKDLVLLCNFHFGSDEEELMFCSAIV